MTTAHSDGARPPATDIECRGRAASLPLRLNFAPVPHDGVVDGTWRPRTYHPAAELG